MGPAAAADFYPSRPVTLIVPFAAGGPTDTVARVLAGPMGRSLGQTVVVENITGAAGSIGVGHVAHSPGDGYTLSIGHWSTHVLNGAIYDLSYDLLKDLEPISVLPNNPMLIVSKNSVPATNLKELIAWIAANNRAGKQVTDGTAGLGSASHVAAIYFQNAIGANLRFVPYRGTGPALLDLLGGNIDLIVDQVSDSSQQVRGGEVRAYAVTAKTRLASLPDIPTVDEAGAPGLYINVWHGLWAPKGTPPEIIAKLSRAVQDGLADAQARERFAALGLDVPPRDQQTPEALDALQRAEIAKWWPIIKAAGIRAE
jgi:tripartite-type tricarboxylate transporter receptor subunit TctC